jgi:hypothetical protein
MLNKINLAIFLGLSISGFFIAFDFLFYLMHQEVTLFAKFAVVAVFTGWFFGALAVILFLFGSILFLSGHMENYWNSLYPLNIGLTLLGLCSFAYNPNQHQPVWIFAAFISALIVSLLLHKLNVIKYKALLPILVVSSFIDDSWSVFGGFIGSIIFISLSFLSGVSKTILGTFKRNN